MAKVKMTNTSDKVTKMKPPLTPEAMENQLIALATELAAKQLRDGTASSQVITHYLKLGSSKEKLEQEIGYKIPLGASNEVDKLGKRIVNEKGIAFLNNEKKLLPKFPNFNLTKSL